VDFALALVPQAVSRLRELSPATPTVSS